MPEVPLLRRLSLLLLRQPPVAEDSILAWFFLGLLIGLIVGLYSRRDLNGR
jgi:hypothetical protein